MKRKNCLWLISIFIFSIISFIALEVYGEETNPNDVVSLSDKIKLYAPINVKSADMFEDGGTIEIDIEDSRGQALPFDLDGRLATTVFSGEKTKDKKMFIGGYPGSPGAIELSVGGDQEKIILRILEDWVKLNVSQEALIKLSKTQVYSDEARKINCILSVINTLKNR